MAHTWTSLVVLVIGSIACVIDLRTHRIPNGLTYGAAIAALLVHTIDAGATGFATASTGWVAGVAMFFLPFALGGLGAGDVKLLAALGAWLGPTDTVWLALYTGVCGGAIALVSALAHGYLRTALRNISLLIGYWRVMGLAPLPALTLAESRGPRVAYGMAIFSGAVVTTWLR
jgi:prepilin peptidase CpaA